MPSETVQTILQLIRSLPHEVLDKAPEVRKKSDKLYNIMPKIVVGGDQNVGKSALLNHLMPECVQGQVALRSASGVCTLSITTIAFVKSKSIAVTIKARGASRTWTPDVAENATTWLADTLQEIQQNEAATGEFFQFETSIVVKHPEIPADYALIDMPGLRAGSKGSENIEAEFERLIQDADLFIAAELAQKHPDTVRVINPDTLSKLRNEAKTIFVMTWADGITNLEDVPEKFAILQARSDIHKFALTYTSTGDEASVLAEKTAKVVEVPDKYVAGTAALRREIKDCYSQLMASKMPEALEVTSELMDAVQKRINQLKPSMSEMSGLQLIARSKKEIVDPACFANDSELSKTAANAMKRCETPYGPKYLGDAFAEKHEVSGKMVQKGHTLTELVVRSTAELQQGRVPGTEGMYNYLEKAYKIIGEEMLLQPCTEAIKEQFTAMKTETIKALLGQAEGNRQYDKIVDTYCKAIAALSVDPSPSLHPFLKDHKPTSDTGYPHNYSAKLVLEQVKLAVNESRNPGGSLEALQHALQEPMHHLMALSDNSEYIVMENAKNAILWYWEGVFSRELINRMKHIVGAFHESIKEALDKCQEDMIEASVKNPDLFKTELDAADQQTLEMLESALSSLKQVAGTDAMRTPPASTGNSGPGAVSGPRSSIGEAFRRLGLW